jgi:hypothetical protein
MKRAIVVYLDYTPGLLRQFACLYTSYKFINCSHDTDIVVFAPSKSLKLVPDDCIKVELNPLDGIWSSYRFINSISCLIDEKSSILENYDFILRSDVDTFLTPSWNHFYPEIYTVGKGAYYNTVEVKEGINRVSQKFNTRQQGIHNIGSTHYGETKLIRDVCKLTLDINHYLIKEEFAQNDGEWPSWFKGVSLLYATEIATNHLVDKFEARPDLLDFDSTSRDSIYSHPHIHCWHTDNLFSKFQYEYGAYDNIVPEDNDEIRHYCLRMSLDAKMKYPQLYV